MFNISTVRHRHHWGIIRQSLHWISPLYVCHSIVTYVCMKNTTRLGNIIRNSCSWSCTSRHFYTSCTPSFHDLVSFTLILNLPQCRRSCENITTSGLFSSSIAVISSAPASLANDFVFDEKVSKILAFLMGKEPPGSRDKPEIGFFYGCMSCKWKSQGPVVIDDFSLVLESIETSGAKMFEVSERSYWNSKWRTKKNKLEKYQPILWMDQPSSPFLVTAEMDCWYQTIDNCS